MYLHVGCMYDAENIFVILFLCFRFDFLFCSSFEFFIDARSFWQSDIYEIGEGVNKCQSGTISGLSD